MKFEKLIVLCLCIQVMSLFPSFFPTWTGQYTNMDSTEYRQPSVMWGDNQNKVPLPTNRWFSSLTYLIKGEDRITDYNNVYPYLINLLDDQIQICSPTRLNQTKPHPYVQVTFQSDFALGVAENLNGVRRIIGSVLDQPLSVTFKWGDDNQNIVAPLVRGMAYVTCELTNLTPQFNSIHAILDVNGLGGSGSATGTKFKVSLNNNQVWLIYTSTPITLSWSTNSLVASSPYTGVVRIAELGLGNAANAEKVFDQYQSAYPISGTVTHSVTGDQALIQFNWKTKGTGDILMICLPHHQKVLQNPSYQKDVMFKSSMGTLIGVSGNTWALKETLPTISWNAPRDINPKAIPYIKQALQVDQGFIPWAPDTYSFGKEISKLIRIGLIALQVDQKDIAGTMLANFKKYLSPWIDRSNADPLFYDSVWGGICTKDGLQDKNADFGMGWYNDHHFHFGYFIYAAAVFRYIAQQLGVDATTYAGFIKKMDLFIQDLIKDIANDKSDSQFPDYRMMDWFVGHSFAAGLFPFADGKNQESSAEAVNAWYGIYLYGLVTGNKDLENRGRVLLATEINSAKTYWHMIPGDDSVYPASFAQNTCVGVVWESKADYATFFGMNVEYIHMIQFLPFTPITENLIAKEWNTAQYQKVKTALTRPASDPAGLITDAWRGLVYMSHAISDPKAAWSEIQTLDANYDSGNSQTNTLYWVATRPGFGTAALPKPSPTPKPSPSSGPVPSSDDANVAQMESLFTPGFLKAYTNRDAALSAFQKFLQNAKLPFDDGAQKVFDTYYPKGSGPIPSTSPKPSSSPTPKPSPASGPVPSSSDANTALMSSLFTKDFLNSYTNRTLALKAFKEFLSGVNLTYNEQARDLFNGYYPKGKKNTNGKNQNLTAPVKGNVKDTAHVALMKSLFTPGFLKAYTNRDQALQAYNTFLKSVELVLDDQAMAVFNQFYPKSDVSKNDTQKIDTSDTQMGRRTALMKTLFTPKFLKAYTKRADAFAAYKDFLEGVAIPLDDTAMNVFDEYYPSVG